MGWSNLTGVSWRIQCKCDAKIALTCRCGLLPVSRAEKRVEFQPVIPSVEELVTEDRFRLVRRIPIRCFFFASFRNWNIFKNRVVALNAYYSSECLVGDDHISIAEREWSEGFNKHLLHVELNYG